MFIIAWVSLLSGNVASKSWYLPRSYVADKTFQRQGGDFITLVMLLENSSLTWTHNIYLWPFYSNMKACFQTQDTYHLKLERSLCVSNC